jgi:regulator of replication initiation timing
LKGMVNCSLIDLYNVVTGTNNKKSIIHQLNDWSKDLSVKQIEYAAFDAYMSYIVGKYFIQTCVNSMTKFASPIKYKLNIIDNLDNLDNLDDLNSLDNEIKQILVKSIEENYIGRLQEFAQKRNLSLPIYNVVHDKVSSNNAHNFKISCKFESIITYGLGDNKKDAKNESAKNMFEMIDKN